ncbi:MAG: L,D-transpeptidase family protein [Lachnospiraceae bacterium]|nr:L,D-transpeptidase family protein [Lachnospiraceae bacterium]MCM1239876.1 L,D-transpeptidase family protein [Lachnospiraceae bacterium]MCM1304526.1 L,D-transpeptidase family protein [Butyrivibrio sp.]MCM1343954.1 L,D-transpeptidase family protein [Muribaculaceae bacterium]MCM1411436.1 L,D-transpeptidase family protein [Lachnospiraceae bacterium]
MKQEKVKNKEENMEESTGLAEEQPTDKSKSTEDILRQTEQIKNEDTAKDQTAVKEDAKDDGINPKATGKRKKILVPIVILLVLIAVCGGIYSVTAFSYKDRFLPGTWVNGIDCTELESAQVAGMLENQLRTYHLEVLGRDCASGTPGTLLGQLTAEDISLTYGADSRRAVDDLLAEQDIFSWLYRRLSDNTYSFNLVQGVAYDEEQLKSIVNGWEACRSDHMTAPRDAYISEYSDTLKGYEVIPEVEGTELNVQQLLELMNAAILSQETSLDVEAAGCYEEPTVRQDAVELKQPVETVNKWLGAKIIYDWNGAEVVVDTELLKEWITMEKDGPVLDEAAVAAFVKEQAEENDTYGKRRNFVTALGVELSLPSGYYGWQTDREAETAGLIEAIQQGRTLSREPVYASMARQKGKSDIGSSYVEVDLTHQHLYLYEDGAVIFETDFVSGSMSSTPDCVTPEGVFGISYKTTNAVLRGADYETPVNYWMPFYGNYGLHDATWRGEFGGQIYITNGSHGCVNLPLGSAATIYEHVSTGFPVICYYYQVDPLAVQPPAEEEWYDDSDDEE